MNRIAAVTHSNVSIKIPAGACDCHTHVFGPDTAFPYDAGRAYTPGDASIAELTALHRHLGIDRVVIVHPSPYGTDNAASADAMFRIGRARARGVAVIEPNASAADVRLLDAVGFRGARVNLETAGVFDPNAAWERLSVTAATVAPFGWHVQTFCRLSVIEALADRLATLPTTLVVDHFGRLEAARGLEQPGFGALRRLVASGKSYVKVSAAYRVSTLPDADDVRPFAQALISDNSDRVVWGSDWPHPGGGARGAANRLSIEPFMPIDDGAALNRLAGWCGDAATLQRVLVDNPARLYGF